MFGLAQGGTRGAAWRSGRNRRLWLLTLCTLLACLDGTVAVPQLTDDESDVRQPHGASKSGGDGDLEPGEVAMAYPKSLNDFYKGKWVVANATGAPKFRHTSGDIVFQIVTRAHGREMKHMRLPGKRADIDADTGKKASLVLGDGIMGGKGVSMPADADSGDKGRWPGKNALKDPSDAAINRDQPAQKPSARRGKDVTKTSGVRRNFDTRSRDGATRKGDKPTRLLDASVSADALKDVVANGDATDKVGVDVPAGGAGGTPGGRSEKEEGEEKVGDGDEEQEGSDEQEEEEGKEEDNPLVEGKDAGSGSDGTGAKREDDVEEDDESGEGDDDSGKVDKMVVEEVDMVQVDLVIRDGSYSSIRDMHTYMQGIYRKSSGRLQLWTVCNSPECGMYMLGGLRDGAMSGQRDPDSLVTNPSAPGGANKTGRGDQAAVGYYGFMGGQDRFQGASSGSPYRGSPTAAGGRAAPQRCLFLMKLQVHLPDADDELSPAAAGGDGGIEGLEDGGGGVVGQDSELIRAAHQISLSGNITSTNCGFALHVNATAMNFEVYYTKAMHYTLMVTAASFMQVLLLVRQIDYSNSRSSAVKVSLLTIGQQAVMDSYLCLMHLTTGIVVEALFNAFATAAFFKFMIFSIFEMRYLLIIWKARRPQGFQEGWNSMRRELSMLYSRFYGCLLAGIVLIYQMQRYSGILILLIYSFWLPQIIHNIHHDHRKPLLIRYIVGMSGTRLLIPLYALACPNNFLHSEPNYSLACALLAWVGLQVAVLVIQHYKGPRFFIPRRFRPDKYDYYRRVPMVATSLEGEDCAICMMPVGGSSDSSPRVVTPCDHVFHQDCLKRWMDIKMECPVCRRQVPDIDDD